MSNEAHRKALALRAKAVAALAQAGLEIGKAPTCFGAPVYTEVHNNPKHVKLYRSALIVLQRAAQAYVKADRKVRETRMRDASPYHRATGKEGPIARAATVPDSGHKLLPGTAKASWSEVCFTAKRTKRRRTGERRRSWMERRGGPA